MLFTMGLLVEPVALVAWALAALALALLLRRGEHKVIRLLAFSTLAAYGWISTPFGANLMLGLFENHSAAQRQCGPPAEGSVIVVLAGGIDDDVVIDTDVGRLHGPSLRRVIAAVELAASVPGSQLVMAGGSGSPVREADLMARLATALGHPSERIRTERDSQNTYENAFGCAPFLPNPPRAGGAIQLVTSALHMPRAAAAFRAQGLETCPYPVDRQWVIPPLSHAFIPQISALRKSSEAWHEAIGLVVYWAAGRLDAAGRGV